MRTGWEIRTEWGWGKESEVVIYFFTKTVATSATWWRKRVWETRSSIGQSLGFSILHYLVFTTLIPQALPTRSKRKKTRNVFSKSKEDHLTGCCVVSSSTVLTRFKSSNITISWFDCDKFFFILLKGLLKSRGLPLCITCYRNCSKSSIVFSRCTPNSTIIG